MGEGEKRERFCEAKYLKVIDDMISITPTAANSVLVPEAFGLETYLRNFLDQSSKHDCVFK